jgi:hypothetical protein
MPCYFVEFLLEKRDLRVLRALSLGFPCSLGAQVYVVDPSSKGRKIMRKQGLSFNSMIGRAKETALLQANL